MKAFTETERQEFLAGKHIAVLSVAADGRPPASVPIWYDYSPGGNIRIGTGASSRKARLIERAGAVTLVVQREEVPYQYVVVEGTVVHRTREELASSLEPVDPDDAFAVARAADAVDDQLFASTRFVTPSGVSRDLAAHARWVQRTLREHLGLKRPTRAGSAR